MIKPYYEENGITIYNGDCRDILPHLPKVDLVLTDPPYGIEGAKGNNIKKGKSKYEGGHFEDNPEFIEKVVIPAIFSIPCERKVISSGSTCMMIYPKPAQVGGFYYPASASWGPWGHIVFSPILFYGKDPKAGKEGQTPPFYYLHESAPKNGHPCPKPIKAWSWLLNRSSLEGETILDPFMGSGTTLVAAKSLGRKAIGIEISEDYCKIAIKRLKQEYLPLTTESNSKRLRQEVFQFAPEPIG